jgi:hypothetical protein
MKLAADGTLLQACDFLPALQSRDTLLFSRLDGLAGQHR